MKAVLKVLPLILFTAIPASAQDPELRREAVQLLERANGVSLSPKLPNLERVNTFRVFDSSSGPQEGTFTRVVVQGTGKREESRFGDELIENSEFFSFAGELVPAKITYSFAGVRKLEILQTMTELTDASENVLAAPREAQIRNFCKTYRRAIGTSMPQPKAGKGGRDIDVAIRGIISTEGKVHEAVVQSAERPDLGAEALALVQQWVFTPAVCDGNPNTQEAVFILHFHGR